ncbi:MAG: ABC transporter ATP-binding protein, partial [Solirubrobacteraceae bacterium]
MTDPESGRDHPGRVSRLQERLFGSLQGMLAGTVGGAVAAAPPVPLREIIRHFWPFARAYKRYLTLTLVLIVAVTLVNGAQLYMIKVTVDEVLVPGDLGAFAWIAPLVIGLTLIGGGVAFFESYLSSWVGGRFLLALRGHLFTHIQQLSLSVFQRRRTGDILARLTGDIAAIETLLISGSLELLSAVARIVFFAGALFVLDWRLALVAVVAVPVLAAVIKFASRVIKQASRDLRRRTGAMTATAEESLSNIALAQAYNREKMGRERYERENRAAFDATMVETRMRAIFGPLTNVIQALSALAVLAVGVVGLQERWLSLGGLLLFVAYLTQLYAPLRMLAKLYGVIYGASAGAERVIEL